MLRIVLIGAVGVAVLVPLFFVGMFLKPKLPPEGTRIYFGAGFQFQHPEEWRVLQTIRFGPATAPGLSLQAVGIDELNAVLVSRYAVDFTASGDNLDEIDGLVRTRMFEILAASGSWTAQS